MLRACLLIALFMGCTALPPAEYPHEKPLTLLIRDVEKGRFWTTPLANHIELTWSAIKNEKVVLEIHDTADKPFLDPVACGKGDVVDFKIGEDALQLEVLTAGNSKEQALRFLEYPSWYANQRAFPEDLRYSVIRISPSN